MSTQRGIGMTGHAVFNLVLMTSFRCNLACRYCYVEKAGQEDLPDAFAERAIQRALDSVQPEGKLELGFFGGEPLLDPNRVHSLMDSADASAAPKDVQTKFYMTTNGTIANDDAMAVLTDERLRPTISCDGLPEVQDTFRPYADGRGSSSTCVSTIRKLLTHRDDFTVAMVVGPKTLDRMLDGIRYLHGLGVKRIAPTLDLWAKWKEEDIQQLEATIPACADYWADHTPALGLAWFDDGLNRLAQTPRSDYARCSFGDTQVVVAPSGRLYPCERLVGCDSPESPVRLPGHVTDDGPFGGVKSPSGPNCPDCTLSKICQATCRCSNYVRTNEVDRPDSLLCRWSKACLEAVADRAKPFASVEEAYDHLNRSVKAVNE